MTTIYKYTLEEDLSCSILEIPKDAVFRYIDTQRGLICLWFQVDTDKPLEQRRFIVYGTGHKIVCPELMVYIGSVQAGMFVWHVFEQPNSTMA